MKLYDKKKIRLIIFSIIGGMIFSTFLLYEQRGKIGKVELFALGFTLLIAISISSIIIRKGNK